MAPIPGKYRMVNAVSSPDRTSQGTGHQAGAGLEKIYEVELTADERKALEASAEAVRAPMRAVKL